MMENEDNHSVKPFLPKGFLFSLMAAFRFLTILPVSWKSEQDIYYLPYTVYFFPVVGIVIGAMAGGFGYILAFFLPDTIVCAFLIILLVSASGGLHLDGLADSCDGLFSSRPPEKMLEIMKDSNVGAMGVIGIVSIFFLKFSAFCSINQTELFSALVLITLSGRLGILLMMALLQYVRGEKGIGSKFINTDLNNVKLAAAAGMLWYGVCLLFFPFLFVLFSFFMTLVTVFSFSWFCYKKIGGFTGDTLGAVCELCEVMVAVSLNFLILI